MADKPTVTTQSFVKSGSRWKWRMPSVLRLIGLKNFIWLLLPIAMAGAVYFKGTPHVLFRYAQFGSRKTECHYFGYHPQTVPAYWGECPYVVFLK